MFCVNISRRKVGKKGEGRREDRKKERQAIQACKFSSAINTASMKCDFWL